MHVKLLQLCLTLWEPMDSSPPGSSVHGILQEEYWSGFPCPPPGDLPDPGVKPASLMFSVLAGGFFTTSTNWEGIKVYNYIKPLNHLEYSKTS